MPDLVDIANHLQAKDTVLHAFNKLDETDKLALCANITRQQIKHLLTRLPVQQQKETLAILTHEMMLQWRKNEN